MNLSYILKYGHQTVLKTVDGSPDQDWERGGVCGVWSVKDIIAHLASFEHTLVDVLNGFLDGGPTSYLDEYRTNQKFNFPRRSAARTARYPGTGPNTPWTTSWCTPSTAANGSTARRSRCFGSGPALGPRDALVTLGTI